MKPSIKKRWLEALRSGKYQQGKGVLLDKDHNFCCLGVLCDIAGPELGGQWDPALSGTCGKYYTHIESDDGDDVQLPSFVWEGLNLSDAAPDVALPLGHPVLQDDRLAACRPAEVRRVSNGTTLISLTVLNDRGFTFAEIADLIEQFIPETPE